MIAALTPQAAIAGALDDVRVIAAVLSRTQRHGVVGLDLRLMAGGAQYLAADVPPNVQVAYTGAVDAALTRLPGLEHNANVIRRRRPHRASERPTRTWCFDAAKSNLERLAAGEGPAAVDAAQYLIELATRQR